MKTTLRDKLKPVPWFEMAAGIIITTVLLFRLWDPEEQPYRMLASAAVSSLILTWYLIHKY